jgi:hypothetical protein
MQILYQCICDVMLLQLVVVVVFVVCFVCVYVCDGSSFPLRAQSLYPSALITRRLDRRSYSWRDDFLDPTP